MKLLEYKGKELLSKYNIAIQKSVLVESPDNISLKLSDLTFPVVIKAQIMAGGRGKAGGIRFADNLKEAEEIIKSLLGFNIKGHIVKKLLIAQKVEGTSENYLSIILDRYYKSPMIIFSPIGGVDIEETARENPDKIIKIPVNPLFGIKDYIIRYIIKKACLPDVFFNGLQNIVTNIYRLFLEYDCILCEINPLLVTEDNDFIAIDAKIDIDDSSLYRHPDISEFRDQIEEDKLILEARKYDFLYIPIDSEGFVSVMSNGSGMLMSCIDLITKSSLIVGSALDLGGGATSDRISEAIKIVFKNKRINYLFISVFGGITRCDEVAGGIRDAIKEIGKDKILIVRIEGTNKEIGLDILKNLGSNVSYVQTIGDGIKELVLRKEI